jgi:hypothetical protein
MTFNLHQLLITSSLRNNLCEGQKCKTGTVQRVGTSEKGTINGEGEGGYI